jgi:rubrerythrin
MSIPKKRLKFFLKDEKEATKEYAEWAKKSKNEEVERMFEEMSRDEHKHAGYIQKMLALTRGEKIDNTRKKDRSLLRQVHRTYLFDDVDD